MQPVISRPQPRLDYIDNLRVLACFLVLLTHSSMPASNPETEGSWLFALSFIGSPSSELFLALSGTVLLPVKTGFAKFYRRRFIKLIPPLVIWSILGVLLYTQTHDLPWSQALQRIVHIPVQPAIGVYWFVYAMVGLYLLAPYISPWLKNASKLQIEWFLSLWLINMTLPIINYLIPTFSTNFITNGNYYWELCYFGGFLGYWLMGYYLNRYPIKVGCNFKFTILLILTISYPIMILCLKTNGHDVTILTDNLQLGSAVLVAALYTLLQNIRLSAQIQKSITGIAKYSFGIYLTHIYIAREMFWGLFDGSSIHIFPRTFLIALLTLATGYFLTRLLSIIPNGKYITGA